MKKIILGILFFAFFIYSILILRPVFQNKLSGTFATHVIPREYTRLASTLNADKTFYRIFWVPTVPTYSFYSFTHPQIPGEAFLNVTSTENVIDDLYKPNEKQILQNASVKYVVVPFDSEGEIFLSNRKYDVDLYEKTIESIKKISWLKQLNGYGRLAVFEITSYHDHFWIMNDPKTSISYTMITPTQYIIHVTNGKIGDVLVFTDAYDSNWTIVSSNKTIQSKLFEHLFNSFVLQRNGSYTAIINYSLQQWIIEGSWISISTLMILIITLLYLFLKVRKDK